MITDNDFEKILKAFDFERVKKAMNAVGWQYASGEPVTIEELKNMAWTLFEGFPNWNDNARCASSSGGFTLRKPHGAGYLTLSFCIEERHSDLDYDA